MITTVQLKSQMTFFVQLFNYTSTRHVIKYPENKINTQLYYIFDKMFILCPNIYII